MNSKAPPACPSICEVKKSIGDNGKEILEK